MKDIKNFFIYSNQCTFKKCCQIAEQVMRKQKRINIIIEDNFMHSSGLYFMMSPNNQIDINSLIMAVMNKKHKIRSVQISNCSSNYFRLDSKILDNIRQNYCNINTIDLYNCNIGDKGIEMFQKTSFQCLLRLKLSQNQLTKKGVQKLASCKLKHLKQLDVSYNKIGNAGLSFIAKADLPQLKGLNISQCNLTMEAVRLLWKTSWKKFFYIFFQGNIPESLYTQSLKEFTKNYYPSYFKMDESETYSNWREISPIRKKYESVFAYVKIDDKNNVDGFEDEVEYTDDEESEVEDREEDDEFEYQ